MKEQLYVVPGLEAFKEADSCPLCALRRREEESRIDALMSSAYMEPDTRVRTNALGFCAAHSTRLFACKNRLGMALMLQTHLQSVTNDLEELFSGQVPVRRILPGRSARQDNAKSVRARISGCVLCKDIAEGMKRYTSTIVYLYKQDPSFREKLAACSGFCLPHFADLLEEANVLPDSLRAGFVQTIVSLQMHALQKSEEALAFFVRSFDYRYADEPLGEAASAVESAANLLRGACCGKDAASSCD